jgi:spermidine synthase
MKRVKNIVSFLYPILVEGRNGSINPYLEVMRYKGKYLLNSQRTNYSFGGLHTIFERLFGNIDIGRYDFKNILVLGMGGGSIVYLLREKYGITCPITAIEEDDVVIELAKKYFNIEKYKSLTIVNSDAYEYTSITDNKYDLIISDVFIEQNVPKKFASTDYLKNLKRIANRRCCIIYNKMTELPVHKKEFLDLTEDFMKIFPDSEIHTLYVNNSENSLLYFNSLPITLKEFPATSDIKQNQEDGEWVKLKPIYFV